MPALIAADVARLGLVDVIVILLVVGAVIGTLRRGGGLLAALGSALGTALVAWLLVAAAAAWAPPQISDAARASGVAHLVPVPEHAIHQAEHLLGVHDERPTR